MISGTCLDLTNPSQRSFLRNLIDTATDYFRPRTNGIALAHHNHASTSTPLRICKGQVTLDGAKYDPRNRTRSAREHLAICNSATISTFSLVCRNTLHARSFQLQNGPRTDQTSATIATGAYHLATKEEPAGLLVCRCQIAPAPPF